MIACILDPRNKRDCVHYYFEQMYCDDAQNEVDKVRNLFKEILGEYQKLIVQNKVDGSRIMLKVLVRGRHLMVVKMMNLLDQREEK